MLMDDTQGTTQGATGGRFGRSLWLASRSPRRRQLLAEYGYEFSLAESGLDDGDLDPGTVDPAEWVMALAYLKAIAAVRELDPAEPNRPVLGADTVCVIEGRIVGQPTDENHAREILLAVSDGAHHVLTGVAIVCPQSDRRDVFFERALVTVGDLTPFIGAYVASGDWRGKAGAYNLAERLDEGWPIEHDGDPTSIMGLPMRQLNERLDAFCD